MGSLARIFKNIGFSFSSRIFIFAARIVVVSLLARYLGQSGFGKYSYVFAFVAMFEGISDFGINTILIREVATDKLDKRNLLGNALSFKVLLSCLTFLAIFTIVNLLEYSFEIKYSILFLSAAIILNYLANTFFAIFRAYEKLEYESLLIFIDRGVYLALIIFIVATRNSFLSIFLAYLAAVLVKLGWGIYLTTKRFLKPRLEAHLLKWKYLIKESWPMGLFLLLNIIYLRVDIIILNHYLASREVGIFAGAYRIIDAAMVLPVVILAAIFPVISKLAASNKDSLGIFIRGAFKAFVAIALPLAISIIFLSDYIIQIILGKEFLEASNVLRLLSFALILMFFNYLFCHILNAIHRQKWFTISLGTALVLKVYLNFALVPKMGYIGAAIATVVSEFFIFILGLFLVIKFAAKIPFFSSFVKPVAASLAMYLILSKLGIIMPFRYMLGIATYFLIIILTKIFRRQEIELLKENLPALGSDAVKIGAEG